MGRDRTRFGNRKSKIENGAEPRGGVPLVTLYRRPACPLCDEAERMLERLAPRLRFRIESVDIESDDGLLRRYMLEIPVITVAGREVARAPLRPRSLEEALREALP